MGHVTGGGVAGDSLPLTTLTLVVIDPQREKMISDGHIGGGPHKLLLDS